MDRIDRGMKITDGNAAEFAAGNRPGGALLTAEDAAAKLRVPVSWVRKHGDQLPGFVRLGKYVRWNAAGLDQFIARGGRA